MTEKTNRERGVLSVSDMRELAADNRIWQVARWSEVCKSLIGITHPEQRVVAECALERMRKDQPSARFEIRKHPAFCADFDEFLRETGRS